MKKLMRWWNQRSSSRAFLIKAWKTLYPENDHLRHENERLRGHDLDECVYDAAVNVACNNWRRKCSILQIALGETALQLRDSEAKLAQCREMLRSAREVAEGELAARLRYETLLAECMRKNKSHDEKTTS
jgi:hypothetical protein